VSLASRMFVAVLISMLGLGMLIAVSQCDALRRSSEVASEPASTDPPTPADRERSSVGRKVRLAPMDGMASEPDPKQPVDLERLPNDLADEMDMALRLYRFGCERLGVPAAAGSARISLENATKLEKKMEEIELAKLENRNITLGVLRDRFSRSDPSERLADTSDENMKRHYPGFPEGYYWQAESGQALAWRIDGDEELENLDAGERAFNRHYVWPAYVAFGRYFVFGDG
jgi:hypothetical protein